MQDWDDNLDPDARAAAMRRTRLALGLPATPATPVATPAPAAA